MCELIIRRLPRCASLSMKRRSDRLAPIRRSFRSGSFSSGLKSVTGVRISSSLSSSRRQSMPLKFSRSHSYRLNLRRWRQRQMISQPSSSMTTLLSDKLSSSGKWHKSSRKTAVKLRLKSTVLSAMSLISLKSSAEKSASSFFRTEANMDMSPSLCNKVMFLTFHNDIILFQYSVNSS